MTEIADYEWLVSDAAKPWLRQVDVNQTDDLTRLSRLRRELAPERARLVVELLSLRQRGRKKFGQASARMFFTRTLLEQATDLWIAAYKARRLSGLGEIADLCCGIGGDLLGFAGAGRACGLDSSPTARLLAEHNLTAVHGGTAGRRAEVRLGDVQNAELERDQPWHVDPDRRATGRRRTDFAGLLPGPEVIARLSKISARGAVKLAPATQLPDAWSERTELEWISRDRQCRQLVAWLEGATAAPGTRRATCITPQNDATQPRADSFVGDPNDEGPIASHPGRFLIDLDPAIHASGLLQSFAAQSQLSVLGPGGGYLTCDSPFASPLAACFETMEVLPLRERVVGKTLRERGVGALEIKQRGVGIDPEKLQRRLKLSGGDEQAVLLLTRIGQRRIAIVARRLPKLNVQQG